ncbi:MAG: glycoside hydrolase family 3 C-terminal domain-containing protein [Eubacteriales bacterium]|nr:glycoside hydrolase family 3 C-terminal domain-containing protein [Eubacteriales bacterium]
MKRNIKELISQMTLEEKAGMCSGKDFWHLKSVRRLGIPEVMVSDGPHGLRKQDQQADHLGMNESIKAVCFPAACATACTFDRELLEKMGKALGEECQAEDVSVLLGPAVNIKRSPLCGRNFEYFSEDPYLSGQIASSFIKGVQSKGIGTSIKHFACNNQEYRRMSCSSELDERTLREIYLPSFETAVKEAQPRTVMCSYNQVNGEFASQSKKLLNDILRDEWGFKGYVMSDWGAVNERVPGLAAGLELEMPASCGSTDRQIVTAVQNGTLSEQILDRAVERILNVIFDYADHRDTSAVFDKDADHELAARIEEESIVLLQNDGILPLSTGIRAAFIGEFAQKPRFQGGGSSHINSFKVTNALEGASGMADITYAQGYRTDTDEPDEALEAAAVEAAKAADAAVLFVGLPDSFESEGYDRTHMQMPSCQNRLVEKVCAVQPNTVIVLHNGSPVEMPWCNRVRAIVEVYLGGQAVGAATANVLFGKVNPCGKLAETIPMKVSDNPSWLNFPGDGKKVEYREGIFVGYRYYDTKEMPVRFPFGHGLSYTTFEYSDLKLSAGSIKDTDTLEVSVTITNTGSRAGKETVQLYVSDLTASANRPVKELKNFAKVSLVPGESKTITMLLDKRSFAWYHTGISDWYAASGKYEILIGRSSRDIVLRDTVELISTTILPMAVTPNTTFGELLENPVTCAKVSSMASQIASGMGGDPQEGSAAAEAISEEMIEQMMSNMPLRALRSFAGFTEEQIEAFISSLQ